MSEYLILIYDDEDRMENGSAEEFARITAGHDEFGKNHGANLRGGNALQPSPMSTSLRRDGSGKLIVTDGAFIEAKEALGGYYLIEASDLDQAIAIASDIPTLKGGLEIRPIRIFE